MEFFSYFNESTNDRHRPWQNVAAVLASCLAHRRDKMGSFVSGPNQQSKQKLVVAFLELPDVWLLFLASSSNRDIGSEGNVLTSWTVVGPLYQASLTLH
mgnify:CR=1 FL=1